MNYNIDQISKKELYRTVLQLEAEINRNFDTINRLYDRIQELEQELKEKIKL